MKTFMGSIAILGLLATGAEAPARAFAAQFVNVRLQLDGSADPPGDIVNVRLLLRPEDAPVELHLRPYRLVEGKPSATEPNAPNQANKIKAKANAHRDTDGFVVIKAAVPPVDVARIVEVKIIVPYSALDLPLGKHLIGYECRAIQGAKVIWASATELSVVTLTSEPRLVAKGPGRTVAEMINRTRRLMVPDPDAKTADAFRLVEQIEQEIVQRNVIAAARGDIAIPGGFERTAVESGDFSLTDDPDPRAGTADRSWVDQPKQTIYFATNRGIARSVATDASRFGNEIAQELTYGSCLVNIPSDHERGELEQPKWWQSPNPKKHFLVDGLNNLAVREWSRILHNEVGVKRHDTLVFVHGYNNSFESVTLVGAQLKVDLALPGPVVVFSWPSEGRTVDLLDVSGPYHRDEIKAKQSSKALATVLNRLMELRVAASPGGNPGRIHILAHSLGNRVLLEALTAVAQNLNQTSKPFGHIILAAPDVDHVQFYKSLPHVEKCAETISLYFCREDAALRASQSVHMNTTRIGQGDPLVLRPPVWTIDCDKANTSWLGHGYVVERDELLIDLQLLIAEGWAPARRPTIRKKSIALGTYWQFP